MSFSYADEVKEIATTLIEKYHPHLKDIRIEYIFDLRESKEDVELWGKIKIISSLNAFLASENGDEAPFFSFMVPKDLFGELMPSKKEAYVDHYLCYANVTVDKKGNTKLSINKPDFEEFIVITNRHGAWRQSLEECAKAIKPHSELDDFREAVQEC
jgi:hypothetical protein